MPVEAKKEAEENTNTMAQKPEETVAMNIDCNGVNISRTDTDMDEGKQALPQSNKASDPKPARKRITPIAIAKP